MDHNPKAFWSLTLGELLETLQVKESGLASKEAKKRLINYGTNRLKPRQRGSLMKLAKRDFEYMILLL